MGKEVGAGDKRPVGVTAFKLAVWDVGEKEAAQEASCSSPHNQEGIRSLA